jgi:hypothetical protein
MGNIRIHPPVKIFAAVTYTSASDLTLICQGLESLLSVIELKSDVYDFSQYTDYYQGEMGTNLSKTILVFKELAEPESLPLIKGNTNLFEQKYAAGGKRMINVDPGYLCESKLILATTKNYTHRMYLGQGIYGDIHLCYQQHSFQVQPWTYPDCKQKMIIDFFNRVRAGYIQQLRKTLSPGNCIEPN